MIDFKNRLYELFGFNRQDLIKIDDVTYNANEAGNFVWSFVLHYYESGLDAETVAEVGSWASFRHDEPNEKKAIQAGEKKAKSFVLTKNESMLSEDISERYYQDYDYFYDDADNEYKKFTPSNTLGIMKLYREKYKQQQVPLSKDPLPQK